MLLQQELAVKDPTLPLEVDDEVDERFALKANAVTREMVATLQVEDNAALEMAICLPASWPLKAATVDCRRKVWTMTLGCCVEACTLMTV